MVRFIVCYDVHDDRRRRKIAEALDAYGDRVQASVFELPIAPPLMDTCMREVMELLDQSHDRLAVYRLCASCNGKRIYAGPSGDEPRVGEEEVFIV